MTGKFDGALQLSEQSPPDSHMYVINSKGRLRCMPE
jgi:hypothetical protein